MSQPLDRVFVEVEVRGEREAARDIHDTLEDIERDVDRTSKDINDTFTNAIDSIAQHFKGIGDAVSAETDDIKVNVTSAGATIETSIRNGTREAQDAISDLADSSERDFRRINGESSKLGDALRNLGEGTINIFDSLGSSTQGLSRALAGLGVAGGPAGLAAILATLVVLGSALVPIIIGLGGAFVDLAAAIALVPAAGATLAAVLGTLALTFNGVGDAIDALAKGKAKDIREAFAKISPSARAFAREIHNLRQPLDDLRKRLQEAFFSQFVGQLTLLTRSLLPTFSRGMEGIASRLAEFARELINVARSAASVQTFNKVFESAERIISRMQPIAAELFRVIISAVEAGLPFVEQFFDLIGAGIGKFSAFLDEAIRTGSFQQALEDALDTLKELGGLARAVGRFIVAIFGEAGDEGRSFIQSLTLAIDKMAEFFESAEGQQNIQDLLESLITIGEALVILSGFLVSNAQAWRSFRDTVSEAGTTIEDKVTGAFDSISGLIDAAIPKIQSAAGSVRSFFSDIGSTISSAFNTVLAFGGQIVDFFTGLPDRIVAALSALPGKLIEFFLRVFDTVNFLIGFAIGTIIDTFTQLPDRVLFALARLVVVVGELFNQVREAAITRAAEIILAVSQFFDQLPTRALNALLRLISTVRTAFNTIRSSAVPIIQSFITNITTLFSRLPGLISGIVTRMRERVLSDLRSLARSALDIGVDIITGIGRGIQAGVGAVVALARRAARRILDGMKAALDISSPSRVAAAEIGEPFAQGVSAGINEGTPDIIRTVNTVARDMIPGVPSTITNTTDSQSVVFSPGAIQISLAGNATPNDAQVIGRTVGQSIIDTLARNRVQLRIRTI